MKSFKKLKENFKEISVKIRGNVCEALKKFLNNLREFQENLEKIVGRI